jgi:hypothetical protein
MAHLKSLTFAVAPRGSMLNPLEHRRHRLIAKLEDQRRLVADPVCAAERKSATGAAA